MSERRIKMQEVIISEYQRKAADESVTRMTSGRHTNVTSATAAQLIKDIVKISSDDWMSIGDDELAFVNILLHEVSSRVKLSREELSRRKVAEQEANKRDNEENALCCICRDSPKTMLLFPCRHLCVCECCSDNRALVSCPVCRSEITEILRVFA